MWSFIGFLYGSTFFHSGANILLFMAGRIAAVFYTSCAKKAIEMEFLAELPSFFRQFSEKENFLQYFQECPISTGAPQNHIFSPTLFELYIDDLPDFICCVAN